MEFKSTKRRKPGFGAGATGRKLPYKKVSTKHASLKNVPQDQGMRKVTNKRFKKPHLSIVNISTPVQLLKRVRDWLPSYHDYITALGRNQELIPRATAVMFTTIFITGLMGEILTPSVVNGRYDLSRYEGSILSSPYAPYGEKLKITGPSNALIYNEGFEPGKDVAGQSAGPKISATFEAAPDNSVQIKDPFNKVSMSFKPKFGLESPKKDANRVVYPIAGRDAVKVYTLKGIGIKEDLILNSFQGDEVEFKYDLKLDDGLDARLESDGSLGIYGASELLLGNVSTGSEKDAQLLAEAKKNSEKNNLIFRIPAPFIVQSNGAPSKARATFGLEGEQLSIKAVQLKDAEYPLSIDPSVYVETAAKLMRGNNETNIDFDVDNELIQKGKTTGARFNQWDSTMGLNDGRWNHGTAVAGGYIYSVGGSKSNTQSLSYTNVGADTFTVPAGVTSIKIKAWGGGGGGGAGGTAGAGGSGGGGGFSEATIAVTPFETLNVYVGGGGGAGSFITNYSGGGAGGGGSTYVNRSGSSLIIAPGGGGGGGGDNSSTIPGGAGGPGGGTSGIGGSSSGTSNGGGGASATAVGAGGTGGNNTGSSGSGSNGGGGADGRSNAGATGSANNGGVNTGGAGGNADVNGNGYGAGGGGGGGYFGGGGGSSSAAGNAGGGGGGGGSGFTTGTLTSKIAGSSTNPGNASDPLRGGAGTGGNPGGVTGNGSVGSPGKIVVLYSSGGGSNTTESTVTWAKLSTVSNAIESPNPGTGSCANWCEDNTYNLPAPRKGLSLVAYNGYLFVLGGVDASGNRSSSVFIAKLGANGEPSLWHPTDSNKANWVYWYTAGNLPSERSYSSAAAYNNRLYLVGGQTNASPGGTSTVEMANINPIGTLGTWSSAGMPAIPSVRYGHSVHTYNDRMYLIGGNSNGTLEAGVHYIKINGDGTLNSWVGTNGFTTGRMAWGGNFTTVYGGYVYLMGGCSAVNASGYCTGVSGDIQLASINADGSLAKWDNISDLNNVRIGYGLVSWKNALYRIGGCAAQDSTTGDCLNSLDTNDYGVINNDGDSSTVDNSVDSGTAPCTGAAPTNCNIPPAGDGAGQGGRMSSGVVINNGFIYVVGGCAESTGASSCSGGARMSGNTSYAALSSDGSIVAPTVCSGTPYGSWCVDSTNQINGTNGVGTMAATVFNNTIYMVGGTDGANWISDVYRVSLNNDGSLAGAWSSQTFSSIGMGAARGYSLALTRANPGSAGSNPGNLYVIGGCSGAGGIGCSTYYTDVYKCNISTSGTLNGCSTSGQLQIDSEPGIAGSQGLGLMAGVMYANYIYLIGGSTPNSPERGQVMYAKLDGNNNIVATTGSIWQTSPNTVSPVRRRGFGFGYNGYLYALAGYDPATSLLNDLQFAKINVNDGSIGAFQKSKVTITSRWDLRAIVSNGYAYAIGGCNNGAAPGGCTQLEGSVQTLQLYNNEAGGPTGYNSSANLFSTDRMGASAAIHNGYVYIAGGCTSATDCTDATNNVQYAPLDANGNIGTWANTTAALPADRAYGQLEVAGGTLYYVGGQSDAATDERAEVYYASPSSGNISSWATAANGLPQARTQHSASVWNNRIYVTGGNNTSGAAQSTVYVSPQLNSGGNISSAWTTTTGFNVPRSGHTTITYSNNIYTLGGYNGSNYLNDVQYNKINPDGTIGPTWTDTTSLPTPIRQGDGFAANGYMYLIGGRSADDVCGSNTLVAPISSNTTIASGNNPTGLGEWYETNVKYNGERYGSSAVYHEGKAYLFGGGCTQPGTPAASSLLYDDFDPTIDGTQWSSTAGMSAATFCVNSSGNALTSSGGTNTADTINLNVANGGYLEFDLFIAPSNSGSCNAAESGENVILQYSTNNGSSWTTIATYLAAAGQYNTLTKVTANIPAAAKTSSTRFRWTQTSNSGSNFDHWAIDNVNVYNYANPAVNDDFDPTIDGTQWSSTAGMSAATFCVNSSGNALTSSGGVDVAATNNINTTYGGRITFELFISPANAGSCNRAENNKNVLLQYSNNSGSTWTTIATYLANSGTYNTLTPVSVDIPAAALTSSTRFRWTQATNNGEGDAHWAIDNVVITLNGTPALGKTNNNRVVQTALLSQPQVARYSRLIDTDTDVFPTKWLMNGVDNSIGAQWNLRYRSSTAATAAYGQETNYGAVTLGVPDIYIPKDSAGANTNFARYYYMYVNVDASRAFGYPDDVSRGPTITDITLFFTSDPSKRMRHGKTFTGGELQPLDTPF